MYTISLATDSSPKKNQLNKVNTLSIMPDAEKTALLGGLNEFRDLGNARCHSLKSWAVPNQLAF